MSQNKLQKGTGMLVIIIALAIIIAGVVYRCLITLYAVKIIIPNKSAMDGGKIDNTC